MSDLKRNLNSIYITKNHVGNYILKCLVCPFNSKKEFTVISYSEEAGYKFMNQHFEEVHCSQNPNNKSEDSNG